MDFEIFRRILNANILLFGIAMKCFLRDMLYNKNFKSFHMLKNNDPFAYIFLFDLVQAINV